ncbi:zeta toxin family protein [Lysobacter sp. cf310]|uniref:zeta toxin family protein n=1 Tax=Lysobacter sp. cf310 TaxID=1761790 RepID=UPI0008E2C5A6|nr:zeta toxin family protein [Lysobacter sp. cf310]SFK70431.1 Predicted ABC-type ATPase [Lysobacter sp. cf310]
MPTGEDAPLMVVLAGPNGSGKSTITNALRGEAQFPKNYINADDIAVSLKADVPDENRRNLVAANMAEDQRKAAVVGGKPFAFETVMSTPGKLALFDEAHTKGFGVDLVFVTTESAQINKVRVENRAKLGGHSVDGDKIVERYERAMGLLPAAVEKADTARIYDNTGKAPMLVAQKHPDGHMSYPLGDKTPEWVVERLQKPLEQREKSRAELATSVEATRPGASSIMVDADIGRGLSYKGLVAKTTDSHVMQYVPGHESGSGKLVVHDRSLAPPGDYAALTRPEHRGAQVEIGYAFGADGKHPPTAHVAAPAVAQAQQQQQGQMPPPGQEPPQAPRSKL